MLEYIVLNKFAETVYFSFYTPKCAGKLYKKQHAPGLSAVAMNVLVMKATI